MNNTINLIRKIIENLAYNRSLKLDDKTVSWITNIEFINHKGLLDKSLVQVGLDSIYYEDIKGKRIVTADYSCMINLMEIENSISVTNGTGSFRGEYDIDTNSLKEDTCVVFLRKK